MRYRLTDQHTNERYADFETDVEIRVGDIVPNRDPYSGKGFWWPENIVCSRCDGRGHSLVTKLRCSLCEGDKVLPVKGFHVKMRVLHSRDHIELVGVLTVE